MKEMRIVHGDLRHGKDSGYAAALVVFLGHYLFATNVKLGKH